MRTRLLAVALAVLLPAGADAQTQVTTRAGELTVSGRLNVQYSRSSADGGDDGTDAVDDVFVRRARLTLDLAFGRAFDARIEPDLAVGTPSLADAYARLTLGSALRLSAGQFKRAFSVFELSSGTDLPMIERDGRIEGVGACPGVGGVCTLSRLTERLHFDDRDLGLRAEGRLGPLAYLATVTNGEGKNVPDVNDSRSASGRVVLSATDVVRVAAFAGVHDFPGAAGETLHAQAFGGDVEVGTWRSGSHLLAGVVAGDNWRAGPDAGFLAAQGLASVYLPLAEGARFAAVEPMLRAGWARVEGADGADVDALLLTPGVSLYVVGKNWIGVNVDVYDPEAGPAEWSLKTQAFVYF